MAFIKHGDGQITHVIKTEDLTEEQKKKLKDLNEGASSESKNEGGK